jgi:hypothetical protein
MEQNKDNQPKDNQPTEDVASDRREVIQKLGRFAAYAAPFTVLAMTAQAASATGTARHK